MSFLTGKSYNPIPLSMPLSVAVAIGFCIGIATAALIIQVMQLIPVARGASLASQTAPRSAAAKMNVKHAETSAGGAAAIRTSFIKAGGGASASTSASRLRFRCGECGVVAAIREIQESQQNADTGRVPTSYEMTVRMNDGSFTVLKDRSAPVWRIGENVVIMF